MRKLRNAGLAATTLVAGAALLSFVTVAEAVPYTTVGVPTVLGIGAQGSYSASEYDKLTLDPGGGDFFDDGLIPLNLVTFDVGLNSDIGHSVDGIVHQDITLNGGTLNLAIPYTVDISSSDTLNLNPLGTYSFPGWQLVLLNYGPVINPGGLMTGTFYGQVTRTPVGAFALAVADPVPLPGALVLFSSGVGLLGWMGLRRNRHAAKPSAA